MRRLMENLHIQAQSRLRKKRGFTMVELLIAVAIVAVLSSVAFVGVTAYLRSMGQLERDGIAKQLFVAAQNHLSSARGEGYLGKSEFGTPESAADPNGIHYIVVNGGSVSANGQEIFDLMLPFGSVEENTRAGGNYLIRYDKGTGTVLDVFYCSTNDSIRQFNHRFFDGDDYTEVCKRAGTDSEHKNLRRTYVNNSILGWYGGATGAALNYIQLKAPTIEVVNAERLYVKSITDPNYNRTDIKQSEIVLRLVITGVSSKAEGYFEITRDSTGNYGPIVLDDITDRNNHFANIRTRFKDSNIKEFWPGEDIRIQAVIIGNSTDDFTAYSENRSQAVITNSLFASVSDSNGDTRPDTAYIRNIRHLENLDTVISKLDRDNVPITKAMQTDDLIWEDSDSSTTDFVSEIKKQRGLSQDPSVTSWSAGPQTKPGCYMPISPRYPLDYDGRGNSITGVRVSTDADHPNTVGTYDAGLFGKLIDKNTVSNVDLVDFQVTAAGTASVGAGALAGSASGTSVTNVLARNSRWPDTANINVAGVQAGGLIGSVSDSTSVERCAAAVSVSGSADAGGLIGSASGSTVKGCYSGGHTVNGRYVTDSYNVTGGTNAGGLIGSMNGGTVSYSYSTSSASGATAGGLIGSGSGTVSGSNYCTGLVRGTTAEGAVAGTFSGSISAQYLEIINERPAAAGGFLTPVGNGSAGGVSAIDSDAASYDSFCGGPSDWKDAHPYDAALNSYYNGKYNLKTVARLGQTVGTSDFVADHYGDWPAPEAFVINK